ncbi:hypothetical protein BST97_07750 [Nonlabens spongiae]|uniref:Carboxypeptidase-like regulatory domain-containing protein n=1 Tax=Nonlabens spongiae TaxID=331648 RepID=A0A1W6MK07_9FLAO|nr:carboxypeptidase-like regulatory domain-containing protein [Nonlabens spongiae]ARN77902.1 hypothetical protein BST97_07750 [Nonlabens spongiae]
MVARTGNLVFNKPFTFLKNYAFAKAVLTTALFLLFSSIVYGQTTLTGKVVNAKDGVPISGVAVYLSGTSVGVVTGFEGGFEIDYPESVVAPIVFRMMGYEKLVIDSPLSADLSLIQLVEKPDELETIFIANDDWSRAKKEKYFKQFFLGRVPAAEECVIHNLQDVKLRFNPETNILSAWSDQTIHVTNKILGYDIACDIGEFEIVFQAIPLKVITQVDDQAIEIPTHRAISSYMEFSSYFSEMDNEDLSERKRKRNRKRLYKLSEMKFYRDLVNERLEKERYHLAFQHKAVEISEHVRVRKVGDVYEVSFREAEYILIGRKNSQSFFQLSESQKIILDEYGNCLTPRGIRFGGFIGKLNLSGMLPLDYEPE